MKRNQFIYPMLFAISFTANADVVTDLKSQFSDVKIYSNSSNSVNGHLNKNGEYVGAFFHFDKQKKELEFNDERYTYNGHQFIETQSLNDLDFKSKVMPYFAQKYGFKFKQGTEKNTYVFLDYTCPYSKAFVERGELERLAKSEGTVWVLPISRLAQKSGIINYGSLHCTSTTKEQLSKTFLSWMRSESKPSYGASKPPRNCDYWDDLKPYYGIVSHLKIDGVPAVIKG